MAATGGIGGQLLVQAVAPATRSRPSCGIPSGSPTRQHTSSRPRHNPGDGFFMRHLAAPLAKAAFRRHYADLALMEDVLQENDLDWTVVRPPRLLNRPLKRKYRTADGQNVRGGMFISRADVAHHMLDVLDRPETIHGVIGVAY